MTILRPLGRIGMPESERLADKFLLDIMSLEIDISAWALAEPADPPTAASVAVYCADGTNVGTGDLAVSSVALTIGSTVTLTATVADGVENADYVIEITASTAAGRTKVWTRRQFITPILG